MTIETLNKANKLANKLKKCKNNLKYIEQTHTESTESNWRPFGNNLPPSITIPKSLFSTIGKLIESEYIQEINKLQKELEDL